VPYGRTFLPKSEGVPFPPSTDHVFFILIPLILLTAVFVMAACRVAARADRQLEGSTRFTESSEPAPSSDLQVHDARERHGGPHQMPTASTLP